MDEPKTIILKNNICKAFAGMPCPDKDQLCYSSNDMIYEHIEDFVGKLWDDISLEFINNGHRECFSFMTPAAIRYYLPAYMLHIIDSYSEVDVAFESVIRTLTLPTELDFDSLREKLLEYNLSERESLKKCDLGLDDGAIDHAHKRFLELIKGFTPLQKKVIREFLEYLIDQYPDPDVQRALERYWLKIEI